MAAVATRWHHAAARGSCDAMGRHYGAHYWRQSQGTYPVPSSILFTSPPPPSPAAVPPAGTHHRPVSLVGAEGHRAEECVNAVGTPCRLGWLMHPHAPHTACARAECVGCVQYSRC